MEYRAKIITGPMGQITYIQGENLSDAENKIFLHENAMRGLGFPVEIIRMYPKDDLGFLSTDPEFFEGV